MEQQLINALIKLFSKAGGGSFIKDLIQQTDQNGNPKIWTAPEVAVAIELVTNQTENFGAAEASIIIDTLRKKYNLDSPASSNRDTPAREDLPAMPGVHGLR